MSAENNDDICKFKTNNDINSLHKVGKVTINDVSVSLHLFREALRYSYLRILVF